MKTLNTIQKLSKIGKVLSKIVFIFCVVGFCGCIVGILSMALGAPTLKFGDVTLESILNTEAEVTVGTVYAAMAAGMILKWKYSGRRVPAVNTVMFLYISGVLLVTLMPVITSLPFCFNHRYIPMNNV